MSERDTHFAHFAKLLFADLEPMFSNRLYVLEDGRLNEAEEYTQFIQNYIAQRTYDLARYVLANTPITTLVGAIGTAPMEGVPDLDEWPQED